MLAQVDRDEVAEMIDQALKNLGAKLRQMVREELAALGYPTKPSLMPIKRHEQPPVIPLTGEPAPVQVPSIAPTGEGSPVRPMSLGECGHCGQVPCGCAELHRHD